MQQYTSETIGESRHSNINKDVIAKADLKVGEKYICHVSGYEKLFHMTWDGERFDTNNGVKIHHIEDGRRQGIAFPLQHIEKTQ